MRTTPPTLAVRTLLLLITVYRNTFRYMMLPTCRFIPSCSAYAIDALQRHGAWSGSLRIVRRVLRCNPFSHNIIDQA